MSMDRRDFFRALVVAPVALAASAPTRIKANAGTWTVTFTDPIEASYPAHNLTGWVGYSLNDVYMLGNKRNAL